MDDKRFQLAKYLLDVGSYTRKIKSYILFNHLAASNLTREHFAALLDGDWLVKIIDHENYNPRVIASASSDSLDIVEPKDYPAYLYNALQNPDLIWSKPFRALDTKSQNLLISIFFGSDFGESIEKTQTNFSDLHRAVSAHYGQPTAPTDFEDALKSLESGFVSISGGRVSFVNPSLRDFLRSYLNDREFLLLLPKNARRADWAREFWSHIKDVFKTHPEFLKAIALGFFEYSSRIDATPSVQKTKKDDTWYWIPDDLPVTSRVELLLQWWQASDHLNFLNKALELLGHSKLELISWRDGQSLPKLHWWVSNFVDDAHSIRDELLEAITARLKDVIEAGMAVDDLVNTLESIREHMDDELPEELDETIDQMIRYEFFDTRNAIWHLDSEQSLNEYLDHLDSLAAISGYDATDAKEIVYDRLAELEEPVHDEHRPSFSRRGGELSEEFGNVAIASLFGNLMK